VKRTNHPSDLAGNRARIEQAEARAAQAETRTEQAKTRTELAETRAEQAESRTELAKTRTEQAEIRTEQAETRSEQAETILQRVVHNQIDLPHVTPTRLLKGIPLNSLADQNSPLKKLTSRQREVLQLIAKSQNTKQIADILKVSPKTVEYHRLKMMDCLKVHDVAGLVRLALRAGLISQEG
jgi:DNA-binding CsgD family transcriptional regulator